MGRRQHHFVCRVTIHRLFTQICNGSRIHTLPFLAISKLRKFRALFSQGTSWGLHSRWSVERSCKRGSAPTICYLLMIWFRFSHVFLTRVESFNYFWTSVASPRVIIEEPQCHFCRYLVIPLYNVCHRKKPITRVLGEDQANSAFWFSLQCITLPWFAIFCSPVGTSLALSGRMQNVN